MPPRRKASSTVEGIIPTCTKANPFRTSPSDRHVRLGQCMLLSAGWYYVWIFANLTTVAYVYSPSREATILDEVLAGFQGVLVSDFYGGYDAVPCQQQKCLIHLMRDINEDVLKHPFNDELTFIATRFGGLLREIVDTIDRYGLKRRNLGKHKRAAEQFINDVAGLKCATETGVALQKRIEKNKD